MDYKEALDYIYGFSDYERGSKYTRDPNDNMQRERELLTRLGDPHLQYTNTLIAGTKGKGSTAAYIESVLRTANVRTGLYTQPHLHTFRERSRVNGQLISETEVGALVSEIRAAVEQVEALHTYGSFITYEIVTALAFLYFSRRRIQHAVVEVGLGGRLDVTNITHPLVSVITSISYDHTQILGDTLAQIATEKAGIIKPNGIVVTSAQSPEALLAIAKIAQERNAQMIRVGSSAGDPAQTEVDAGLLPPLSYRYRVLLQGQERQHFTIHAPSHTYEDLETPLLGLHQIENATAALATLEQLHEKGILWDEDALRRGLSLVHWPARMQVVRRQPAIIIDGAHNADSMQKLLVALRSIFIPRRLVVVLGVNKDKDLSHMLQSLSSVDIVILTHANNPRTASVKELRALFAEFAPGITLYDDETCDVAMDHAVELVDEQDVICATGSLYLAGAALRWAAAHGDRKAASEIEGGDY